MRSIAAAGLLGSLVLGSAYAGAFAARSRERVAEIRSRERSAEQAQSTALARDLHFKNLQENFAAELAVDVKAFGVEGVDVSSLARPNRFFHELRRPLTLGIGKRWSSPHLRMSVSVEPVTFRQKGVSITARHTVLTVQNAAKMPLGYYLVAHSRERGECRVRGARMHNAMALAPNEAAEIVICAGATPVVIEDVRVLEVTALGYHYLSQLPPTAVGHDAITAQAHRPLQRIATCTQVPSVRIATLIRSGSARWEDVMDFYSRHNCQRVQYVDGYQLATRAVARLPVVQNAP